MDNGICWNSQAPTWQHQRYTAFGMKWHWAKNLQTLEKRPWCLSWPWPSQTLLTHSTCMWMRPEAYKPWDPEKDQWHIFPRDLTLSSWMAAYRDPSYHHPAGKGSWQMNFRALTVPDSPTFYWGPLRGHPKDVCLTPWWPNTKPCFSINSAFSSTRHQPC